MRIVIAAASLLTLAALPALGQSKPQTRDGFTISFGFGSGSAGATCSGCDTDRQSAPTAYLRLGGALRPNLILAGEINGWSKTEKEFGAEAEITILTVNAVVQWYPQPTRGFFVSGGVGAGSMAADVKIPSLPTISD